MDSKVITSLVSTESKSSKVNEDALTPKSFKIQGILGRGAFGEVYLVTMKKTGKKYAMKVLSKKEIME